MKTLADKFFFHFDVFLSHFFLFFQQFCLPSHFQIIKCIVKSLITTSVEYHLKIKNSRVFFGHQSSGAQSGIQVSQTTWICNHITFNEKYQLFNLMFFFSFLIFSIPMSQVISAINRSGVCYFLHACFCSFFSFSLSNAPDNQCRKQKWCMLLFKQIKPVVWVLACVHAIARIKWLRMKDVIWHCSVSQCNLPSALDPQAVLDIEGSVLQICIKGQFFPLKTTKGKLWFQ